MAKLQPEYPSIQDGAGVCSTPCWTLGGWRELPELLLSSWHMPPPSLPPSLPMLHNFNIVFLLCLICMLSIHNGCYTQFTNPSPFHGFPLQMRQEISLRFITYVHPLNLLFMQEVARANPIFASFHVLFILLSRYLISDIGLT